MMKQPEIALAAIDVTTKAKVLLEALPYVQRFRNCVFVVKYGGAFMDDPDPVKRGSVASDLVFLAAVGIRVVVVHGGGKAISRAMSESGLEPRFERGLRVTDRDTMSIVERSLNELTNLDICATIENAGGQATSVFGNRVLRSRKVTHDASGDPIDIGYVGEVETVETAPILEALDGGRIPVISPVGVGPDGLPYNNNADVAASRVAVALQARRLVYLCDVPGLMRDPGNLESLISSLPLAEIPSLKEEGVVGSGMIPKIDSAEYALRKGVKRVHLVDARLSHSLLLEIFTDRGVGTELVH